MNKMTSYSLTQINNIYASNACMIPLEEDTDEVIESSAKFGGIFSNVKYAWIVNGSTLKVIDTKTSQEISCWVFGSILKDWTTKINCVEELPRVNNKFPLLVVGLKCILSRGMICIFEFTGSKVIRTIEVPHEVTSIGIIETGLNDCLLPGPLRAFDGAIAIGTANGEVYISDLCVEACEEAITAYKDVRDESNPCKMMELSLSSIPLLESFKQQSNQKLEHLSLRLNDVEEEVRQVFVLKGPGETEHAHVNKVEVTVSALHYCPQLGSLLIGYNFGAWQLWNLMQVKLSYTSPIFEHNIPVTNFAVQEPCDDPRAFCYVWAIYNNSERYLSGFPTAVMYALNYESKEWHEGYGFLYEDLRSCSVRFRRELRSVDDKNIKTIGGQCVKSISVNRGITKINSPNESNEDAYSYCFFIWNIWDKNGAVDTYLSLFDLNQWYKEQMPSMAQKNEEIDCSYLTTACLSDIIKNVNQLESVTLDVCVNRNSINQFKGGSRLEEHYFPSSVSFDLCLLRENDISMIKNRGSQKSLLFLMESKGPLCFVEPTELYQQCIKLGLAPLFTEVVSTSSASLEFQREFLLSVALEQQMIGWLCKCSSSSSNGSYSSVGCTLSVLLKWGWQRAHILKQNADNFCVPLFDYSGVKLDANSANLFNNCIRQLKNLTTFFKFILKKFNAQLSNQEVIIKQHSSLEMVTVYLEVTQWAFNVGLLPEAPLLFYENISQIHNTCAPYPVKVLTDYYNKRRADLVLLHNKHFSYKESVLFIDNLIDLVPNGINIRREWKRNCGNGFYPPPSLQALMRTYLIDEIDIIQKHSIVVYVFLDLAINLDQDRYKSTIMQLIKFPAVFQLTPSIIKIIQAFWQLDHGDFASAIEQLLDPLVKKEDLKTWHHRIALRSFLLQGQHNYALLYLQVRQPPAVDVQDLCTTISLYIANDMLDEAFHFQRQNNNSFNEVRLLRHFFKECSRKNHLVPILHLSLSPSEESYFMNYLEEINHPQLEDFKIFYYLQRSRYMDAFMANHKLNQKSLTSLGLLGKQKSNLRDFVVNSTYENMPKISKMLTEFYKTQSNKSSKNENHEKPLSLFVNNKIHNKVYESNFLYATISKTKSIWASTTSDEKKDYTCITDTLPFFKTPTLIESRKRPAPPMMYPDEIHFENMKDSVVLSPAKRPRLEKEVSNLMAFKTPIIERKEPKGKEIGSSVVDGTPYTPQSILKKTYQSNVSVDNRTTPERLSDTEDVDELESSVSVIQTKKVLDFSNTPSKRVTLSPRKSISRTGRPSVHFESLSLERSPKENDEENLRFQRSAKYQNYNERKNCNFESNSKTSSPSTDDMYCTPENSFEEPTNDKTLKPEELKINLIKNTGENEVNEDTVDVSKGSLRKISTPKRRRSYKDISGVPVRSSPRLRRSVDKEDIKTTPSTVGRQRSSNKLPSVGEIADDSDHNEISLVYSKKTVDVEKCASSTEHVHELKPSSDKTVETYNKETEETIEILTKENDNKSDLFGLASVTQEKSDGKSDEESEEVDNSQEVENESTKELDEVKELEETTSIEKTIESHQVNNKTEESRRESVTPPELKITEAEEKCIEEHSQQPMFENQKLFNENSEPLPSTSGFNVVNTTTKEDIYDNLSNDSATNIGTVDPRMNVFEMWDILSDPYVEQEELMETDEIYSNDEFEGYNESDAVFTVDTMDEGSNGDEMSAKPSRCVQQKTTTVEIIEINSSVSESYDDSDCITPIISDPTTRDTTSSRSWSDECSKEQNNDEKNEGSKDDAIPFEIHSVNSSSSSNCSSSAENSTNSDESKSEQEQELPLKEIVQNQIEEEIILRIDDDENEEPNENNEMISSECLNLSSYSNSESYSKLEIDTSTVESRTAGDDCKGNTQDRQTNLNQTESLTTEESDHENISERAYKITKTEVTKKRRSSVSSVSSENSSKVSKSGSTTGAGSLDKRSNDGSESKEESTKSRKRKFAKINSSKSPSVISIRSRSSLTDEDKVDVTPVRRSLRSQSTEAEMQSDKTEKVAQVKRRKSTSVVSLPTIQEENGVKVSVTKERKKIGQSEEKEGKKPLITSDPSVKSKSVEEEVKKYSQSRRLTRRQKMLFEKNLENKIGTGNADVNNSDEEAISVEENNSSFDEMDRIKLLDKSDFQGEKDIEERRSLRSSFSSIAESSVSTNTRNVKKSQSPKSNVPTPTKHESPIKRKLRSTRSNSNASSAVSLASSTPSQKSRKMKTTQEDVKIKEDKSRKTNRGRAASVAPEKPDPAVPAIRTRRLRSTSDLPKIVEEGESQSNFKQKLRNRNKN